MGILAPELVAFTAWDQWREAKELTARVNEIFRNRVSVIYTHTYIYPRHTCKRRKK